MPVFVIISGRRVLYFLTLLTLAVGAAVGGLPGTGAEPAFAEVKIRPLVVIDGTYSTNYYRSEKNETKVFVLRISPGIKIDANKGDSRLTLDYNLSAYFHFDDSDTIDSSDDDYIGHDARMAAFTTVGSRGTLGIWDIFFLTRESAYADTFGVPEEREMYWRNMVQPYFIYDFEEKGQAELAFRYETLRYTEEGNVGSDEVRGILTGTYNLNDKNHLGLEFQPYHRWFTDTYGAYTSLQAKLVYKHEFNEILSSEVGGGWHWRYFEDEAYEDWNDWVLNGSLIAQGEDTRARLTLERNINDFSRFDEYFTAIRVTGDLERQFGENFSASLGGYYQYGDYIRRDREDNVWNINARVGYTFLSKMLELSLAYNYTNRNSDEEGADYNEHQVVAAIGFIYDPLIENE